MTISQTARKRKAALVEGGPGMFVSRVPPAGDKRSMASAADLKQIRNRQEAEALPEGDVRRKKRKANGY